MGDVGWGSPRGSSENLEGWEGGTEMAWISSSVFQNRRQNRVRWRKVVSYAEVRRHRRRAGVLTVGAFAVFLCIVQQAGAANKEHPLHFGGGSHPLHFGRGALSLKSILSRLPQGVPWGMLILREERLQSFDAGKWLQGSFRWRVRLCGM